MQTRPTIPSALAAGIIAGEIAVAAAVGTAPVAPEWIKVTPRGGAQTRDGRSYTFNPETLAARFASDQVEIPVDLDHALALRAAKGERVDAVGFAAELQAREDGTYARVNWLDGGLSVLAARTHRYVSPTFHHDDAGNATWLHSIALVAAPALSMPAVAHAAGSFLENPMKQIAKALGLPETADEAACLAALGARTDTKPLAAALGLPDTAVPATCLSAAGKVVGTVKAVAKALGLPETADEATCLSAIGGLKSGGGELVTQLQTQLATTSARLEAVENEARDKRVTDLLEGALTAKKITPAQREHLAGLCATDAGLAGVQAMLGATAPGLQASGLDGRRPDDGAAGGDPATLSARARKIQDDRRAAGQNIGWAEACQIAADTQA